MFTLPWLPARLITDTVRDILDGIFDVSQSLNQLGQLGNDGREILRNSLISYLQSAAIRFSPLRAGNKQTKPREALTPQVGDVVLYLNSEAVTRYGLITQILERNQVMVKTQLYNNPIDLPMHIRKLTLLFRPTEWTEHGTPVAIEDVETDDPLQGKVKELLQMKIPE